MISPFPTRWIPFPRYQPTPTNTIPETVTLYCFVQGDDPDRIFSVRISMEPTNTIVDMKKAICSEKKSFKEVDYDALQLWKVSEWYLRMLTQKI
jgi:hypothetical protein